MSKHTVPVITKDRFLTIIQEYQKSITLRLDNVQLEIAETFDSQAILDDLKSQLQQVLSNQIEGEITITFEDTEVVAKGPSKKIWMGLRKETPTLRLSYFQLLSLLQVESDKDSK